MLLGMVNARPGDAALLAEEAATDYLAFEFRLFLGPRFEDGIPEGFIWNRPPGPGLEAVAPLEAWRPDLGLAVLGDASGFPPAGLAFLGSVGTYARYTSRDAKALVGVELLRGEEEPSPGVPVRPFWEITEALASPISLTGDFDGPIFTWSAELEVEGLPILEDGLALLALRKTVYQARGGRQLIPWHLWFYGWIMESSLSVAWGSGQRQRLKVGGLIQRLRRHWVGPIRSQARNLARGAQVRASSTLADPNLEASSDDFIQGVQPSVSPDRAVDGDVQTLWISQGEPSRLTWPGLGCGSDAAVIDEVYFRPLPNQGEDATWFRVWACNRITLYPPEVRILNDQAAFHGGERAGQFRPEAVYLSTKEVPELKNRSFSREPIVFCRNLLAFRRFWDPGEATVIEWRRLRGQFPERFRLHPTRGFLHIRTAGPGWNDTVVWGDGAGNVPLDPWPYGRAWTGPWVPLPALGHSIRTWNPVHANYNVRESWEENPIPQPAGPAREVGMETAEWIAITLPKLDLRLGQALAADPGDPADGSLRILREGIPDASDLEPAGAILIDREIITYTGRAAGAITGIGRGAYGTPVMAHEEGAKVWIWEDGRAWDLPKISEVRYVRGPERNPQPFAARLFLTSEEDPRMPEAAGWDLDWRLSYTWTASSNLVWKGPGVRAAAILLVFDQMASPIGHVAAAVPFEATSIRVIPGPFFERIPSSGYLWCLGRRIRYTGRTGSTIQVISSPELPAGAALYHLGGRARANEIQVLPAFSPEGVRKPVPLGDVVALIEYILEELAGLRPGRILRKPASFIGGPPEVYFTRGDVGTILREQCETYRLRLVEFPDATFALYSYFELREEEPLFVHSEATVSQVETDRRTLSDVSQVIVRVRDPVTQEVRTFRHPATPGPLGREVEVERVAPHLLGPLLAEAEYRDAVGRTRWRLAVTGLVDRVWGFQVHSFQGRRAVVTQVKVQEGSRFQASLALEEL